MRTYAPLMPYIGISGFTNRAQVEAVLAGIPVSSPTPEETTHPGRCLMLGVRVSDKTLSGQYTKHQKRCAPVDQIQTIFHPQCFNVIHYNTEDRDADLLRVVNACGASNGVQLNITWPSLERVRELAATGTQVILQLSRQALQECNYDPAHVISRVREYDGSIHYLLLDQSEGKNIPMHIRDTLTLLQALYIALPDFNLVVSGGLGPHTLQPLDVLLYDHPLAATFRHHLSIDSESGCRDENDELSIIGSRNYLQRALVLFEASMPLIDLVCPICRCRITVRPGWDGSATCCACGNRLKARLAS